MIGRKKTLPKVSLSKTRPKLLREEIISTDLTAAMADPEKRPVKPSGLKRGTSSDLETIRPFNTEDSGLNGTVFTGMRDTQIPRQVLREIEETQLRNTIFQELPEGQSDRQLTRRIFSRAFAEPFLDLADLLPHRIIVGWRIVREMARIRGLVAPDETMAEAMGGEDDPWSVPVPWSGCEKKMLKRIPAQGITALRQSELLAQEYQYSKWDEEAQDWKYFPGLPILPPDIPQQWVEKDDETRQWIAVPDYDVKKDHALNKYIELIAAIAEGLQISEGSNEDPQLGRYGLTGLFDPRTVRLAFPTRTQLVTMEEMLIDETLQLLTQEGISQMRSRLHHKYGFNRTEIEDLVKMARVSARLEMEGDSEEDRAIMLIRLENFIQRSKTGLDLRAELAGLKQISIIQGLQRAEVADSLSEFIKVVGEVSEERDIKEAEFTVVQEQNTLPGPPLDA